MDPTAQAEHTDVGGWQEDINQKKSKSMKELYLKEFCMGAKEITRIARFPLDGNNWLGANKEESSGNDNDWRNQLNELTRKEMVDKLVEAVKKRPREDTDANLERFAIRTEEKMYEVAKSESDYLQRISLKVLRLETESTSMDPTAQAEHADVGDWQEDINRKIICSTSESDEHEANLKVS